MPRNLGLDMFKGLAMGLVVLNHAVLWPMRDGDLVSAFAYGIAFGGAGVFAALAVGAGILGESPLSLLGGTFWAILPIFVSGLWYGMRCARAEAAGAPYWARVPGWAAAAVMLASMACGGAATVARSLHPTALWLGWVPYAMALVGGVAALPLAVRIGAHYGGGREPGRAARAIALVGQASLGVYVLHPLVMGPLALLAHGRGGVLVGVGIVVATLAIETPLVRWARGVPLLRRIV